MKLRRVVVRVEPSWIVATARSLTGPRRASRIVERLTGTRTVLVPSGQPEGDRPARRGPPASRS